MFFMKKLNFFTDFYIFSVRLPKNFEDWGSEVERKISLLHISEHFSFYENIKKICLNVLRNRKFLTFFLILCNFLALIFSNFSISTRAGGVHRLLIPPKFSKLLLPTPSKKFYFIAIRKYIIPFYAI